MPQHSNPATPQFSARLASVYHLLFPARPAQLAFLAALAGPAPARAVDLGCGTGEYVAALHGQGYDAYGIELSLEMLKAGRARHPELCGTRGPVRLVHGDMLELADLLRGPFDLAYCIGNTLPHLAGDADVREALAQMWDMTRPSGAVAVQVVNFDRVMAAAAGGAGEFAMAALSREEDGAKVALERRYELHGLPERVAFHTRLTVSGEVSEGRSELLALTKDRLSALLPRRAQAVWSGDYDSSEWTSESPATILVLR